MQSLQNSDQTSLHTPTTRLQTTQIAKNGVANNMNILRTNMGTNTTNMNILRSFFVFNMYLSVSEDTRVRGHFYGITWYTASPRSHYSRADGTANTIADFLETDTRETDNTGIGQLPSTAPSSCSPRDGAVEGRTFPPYCPVPGTAGTT